MNAHTRHVDDETLVLLALGEPAPTSDVAAHVRDCEACHGELSSLRQVTALARDLDAEERVTPVPPPDHVWDAILRGIADDGGGTRPGDGVRDGNGNGGGDGGATPLRRIEPAAPARAWQPWMLTAAAAVLVAVIAVAALLPRLAPDVVAETTLAAVESDRTVEARLLRSGDEFQIEVDTGDLPPIDGYYEVWLADADVQRLLSLGPLTDGRALVLPDAVLVEEFPVVDVSVEPLDGDPTHSGVSLWRGTLPVG